MTADTTTDNTELDQTNPTAPDTDPQADDREADTTDKGNREAARYRRQLREVEAERDSLAGRAEAAQRGLVDYLAQNVGHIRPAALWAAGTQLADLLDDAGNVDPAKVTSVCEEAARNLGLARAPRPDPSIGRAGGATGSRGEFVDAFRPR